MNAKPTCPKCGAALPANAPEGLCPRCLGALNLETETVFTGEEASAPWEPPPASALAPLFPQLELLGLVGRGGMGVVYKARQKELDRIVALKVLPPGIGSDPAFAERFAREAKALARLSHPGIVTVHDFGRAGELFYFLMEFVDGVSLRQLMSTGRVSPREALAIVPQICDALQYAHDQGIVHRDIKPENILLDRQGRVKVADFGLAKLMAPSPLTPSLSPSDGAKETARSGEGPTPVLTEAGKVMGTPQYMAPEQAEHPSAVDHRADIYALGVVFYQMLTGELPGQQLEPPSRKVHIDVRLDEVVLRALEQQPQRRYQQVSEVKTAVETIAASAGSAGAAQVPRRARIRWLPALVFYALQAVLIVPLEWSLLQSDWDSFLRWLPVECLVLAAAYITWGRLHYLCWQALPEKYRATTPAQAIGFLFIPLFNFYWAFVTFPKLAQGFAALQAERPELGLRNLKRLGLAKAILFVGVWTVAFIPGLNSIICLADLVVFFFFYRGVVANANRLLGAPSKPETPAGAHTAPTASWEAARRQVRPVANGLLGLGVVQLLLLLWGWFYPNAVQQSFDWLLYQPGPFAPFLPTVGTWASAANLLVILAAWRMRRLENYALAVAAGILVLVFSPLLPVGFTLGAWALLILVRPEVRRQFGTSLPLPSGAAPRYSRLAIASLSLTLVALLLNWLVAARFLFVGFELPAAFTGPIGRFSPSQSIYLPAWPTLGTVLLAAVGLEDIRARRPALKGAGIAVIGLLCLPLKGLASALFFRYAPQPVTGLPQWAGIELLSLMLALLFSGGVAFWVHAHESRRARAGLLGVARDWWWLSRPAVRVVQGLAFTLLLAEFLLSGYFAYLLQYWEDYRRATASTSQQPATPQPGAARPNAQAGAGSQSLSVGTNASFTVVASGTAPLSYQWQFVGTNQDGSATNLLPESGAASPASPPALEQILARYTQAKGPLAGPEHTRTLAVKGTFTSRDGMETGEAEADLKAPDKWLLVLKNANGPLWRRGFDGAAGWEVSPWSTPQVDPAMLLIDRVILGLYRGDPLAPYLPLMHLTTQEPIAGGQAWVVEVALPGQPPRLWFEQQSGLLRRIEYAVRGAVMQLDCDDYRDVGGLRVPFKLRQTGIENWTLTCREVKLNEPIDDARFARPTNH